MFCSSGMREVDNIPVRRIVGSSDESKQHEKVKVDEYNEQNIMSKSSRSGVNSQLRNRHSWRYFMGGGNSMNQFSQGLESHDLDDEEMVTSGMSTDNSRQIEIMNGLRGGASHKSDDQLLKPASHDKNVQSLLAGTLASVLHYIGESKKRCWITLLFAIIIEIFATTEMKTASDEGSMSKMFYSMFLYIISLLSFAACLKQIDVSVAYAIWSALGTALVSIAGVLMFGEEASLRKVISLGLIMIGVVGLNLSDDSAH